MVTLGIGNKYKKKTLLWIVIVANVYNSTDNQEVAT